MAERRNPAEAARVLHSASTGADTSAGSSASTGAGAGTNSRTLDSDDRSPMGTRTIIPTLREESAPVPFAKLPTVEKELRTQTDNQRSTYDSDDVLIQVRPSRDDLAADYGADTVDFIAVASPDSIRRLVFTAADGPTERAGWRWYPDRLGERTIARVEHNDQLTPIGAVARVSDGGGD